MPIYEYECPVCGKFETIQKASEKPLKVCPQCKEVGKDSKVAKIVSTASFHLKGSGWYKTDYSKSGSAGTSTKPSPSSDSASATAESKNVDKKKAEKSAAAPAKGCGSNCGCH